MKTLLRQQQLSPDSRKHLSTLITCFLTANRQSLTSRNITVMMVRIPAITISPLTTTLKLYSLQPESSGNKCNNVLNMQIPLIRVLLMTSLKICVCLLVIVVLVANHSWQCCCQSFFPSHCHMKSYTLWPPRDMALADASRYFRYNTCYHWHLRYIFLDLIRPGW